MKETVIPTSVSRTLVKLLGENPLKGTLVNTKGIPGARFKIKLVITLYKTKHVICNLYFFILLLYQHNSKDFIV